MDKNDLGICALTGERCELQESHIYPKFVYKYLKQTGGSFVTRMKQLYP
jgi:hypothetical protein